MKTNKCYLNDPCKAQIVEMTRYYALRILYIYFQSLSHEDDRASRNAFKIAAKKWTDPSINWIAVA